MGFSGSANYSQQKLDSDFASLTEQSGIKAGDKGFQVNVKGNADYKASSIGIGGGFSFGGSGGNDNKPGSGVGTDQQGKATTGGDKVPGSNLY